MKIKYLGIIALSLHISTHTACSVNYKMLEQEAGSFQQKIFSGKPIDESRLNKGLLFLNREDTIVEEYTHLESFVKKVDEANKELNDRRFLDFSKLCKKIFKETSNPLRKASIYMLFEKIACNSIYSYQHLKKLEEFKRRLKPSSNTPRFPDAFLDNFLSFSGVKSK